MMAYQTLLGTERYEVRVDGSCEPVDTVPLGQRYFPIQGLFS